MAEPSDFGDIDADISAMQEYAQRLRSRVSADYGDQLRSISDGMTTPIPAPAAGFSELASFLMVHQLVQDHSHQNIYQYGNGSLAFASAAEDMGSAYRGTDAYRKLKVSEVERQLGMVEGP